MGMLSYSVHSLVPICTYQLILAVRAYGLSLIILALCKVENMIMNLLDDGTPSREEK